MKIIHFPTLVILLAMLQACSGDSPPGNQGKSAAQYASSAAVELREQSTSETIAGTLQARRTARIHNQQAGVVSRIHAFTGDRVKQGALLAQLDDKLLAAQRDKANAALEQARLDMHRAEALSKNNLIAEDALARARTAVAMTQADANLAQAQFDYSRIIAPFDGIISERLVDEGDVVANQTHIFTLLDTSRLKAQVFVSEDLLPQLAVNDMATINLESAGKKNMAQDFNGRITRIPPGLDPQTRQAEIEIEINPVPAGAMPGQLCNVTLHGKKIKKLMMDFDALRYDNHGAFVYVVRDNRVQRTAVQTGIQQDNSIEILQGVNAGDMVITKGFTGLQDGKTVNMTEQAK